MDLVKIASVAAAECVRQDATEIRNLQDLLTAYQYAINVRDNGNKINVTVLEYLGGMVDPLSNAKGFRKTPVTFRNGGSSANAADIPRALITLRDDIKASSKNRTAPEVDFLVKQFLWIHPFADGNGRTAWILYNMLKGTLDSPLALPRYEW